MSPEIEAVLRERYPALFHELTYVECGDGWFDLLDALSQQIEHRASGLCRVVQVKEKFGGLRFYFTTEFRDDDETASDTRTTIAGMVAMAEAMSYRLCELCGAPGIRRPGPWIRTLCTPCEEKRRR
jgi:hypothetical protein